MIFKGTLGTGGTIESLPTTHSAGWAYKIIEDGTYAGKVCEVGDLIVAIIDREGSSNTDADWIVVQTNLDGAVIGPASTTDNHVALFDGTSGKLIKSSGTTLADSYVAGVLNTNGGTNLRIWIGTQSQYNAVSPKDANTLYLITG
jgi:hypothetical protein